MGVIPNKIPLKKLSILFIGAHPDDGDIEFGGTAIKYLELGHQVTYLSMTNGDAGHQEISGEVLAKRRYQESRAVADFLGIDYIVLSSHDAELQATIVNRNELIKLIRKIKPDLIVTHRPNDYHTDHRQTSLLVQDAAYLIAVPNVVRSSPRLDYNPVIVYHQDNFRKPYPFSPTVFVDITNVIDKKMTALSLHESQVFEWLPFIEGYLSEVPTDKKDRITWLKTKWSNPNKVNNTRYLLEKIVSPDVSQKIKYFEAFEVCEYGGQLTKENAAQLFPFGIFNLK